MIESIFVKVKSINLANHFVICDFKGIMIKIILLLEDLKQLVIGLEYNFFIYFNISQNILSSTIFGFLTNELKELVKTILLVKLVGIKTIISIFKIFNSKELIKIIKEYQINYFANKTKINLTKSEEIFNMVHNKIFKNLISLKEKRIIKSLVDLGYNSFFVYKTVLLNKKYILDQHISFNKVLKKIILDLNNFSFS